MSGLDLVKKLRCAYMTLPVILASGSLHAEELERHPRLQFAATLLKPFTPGQLLETVKRVLRAADRAGFGREISFPPFADAFRQNSPYRHWGINE